jgi:NAD(P)-dependent dehydrogenase (short-subunit alcohol dehydrogenase family)
MMQGKICMVTGANSGMGNVIAQGLAREGATVVMVCRGPRKGEEAQHEIKLATGNSSIDLLIADLSSQKTVRELVQEFKQRYSSLHVLVNNAGAHFQKRVLSVDGIEMNLAVNHLSSFLLTNLLIDVLRTSAPSRIINIASNAMTRTIDLDDIQSERSFVPMRVYGQAKLQMVLCTYALARRLTGTGVTVNALHPGITSTNLVDVAVHERFSPIIARPLVFILKHFLQTPEQGAKTALYLATSSTVEGVTGKYFVKGREKPSVPISYDVALQERIWKLSKTLVGLDSLPDKYLEKR